MTQTFSVVDFEVKAFTSEESSIVIELIPKQENKEQQVKNFSTSTIHTVNAPAPSKQGSNVNTVGSTHNCTAIITESC